MTVARLKREMDLREFAEWMAYYNLEPFGEGRADLRSGIVASTIANVNRSKGKAFEPKDFMPQFSKCRKREPQTRTQMWNVLSAFGAAQNAKVAARGENQ